MKFGQLIGHTRKIMQKMKQGNQFQTPFCILKKLYISKSKYVLDKSPGIVFPAHFEYDFSTKMFLMLHSIK